MISWSVLIAIPFSVRDWVLCFHPVFDYVRAIRSCPYSSFSQQVILETKSILWVSGLKTKIIYVSIYLVPIVIINVPEHCYLALKNTFQSILSNLFLHWIFVTDFFSFFPFSLRLSTVTCWMARCAPWPASSASSWSWTKPKRELTSQRPYSPSCLQVS